MRRPAPGTTPRRVALPRAAGAVLALAVVLVSGCSRRPAHNVVLVTFDTTRADHIGCYGHPTSRTPTIDRLAREGVLFRHALSAVPVTAPSHSTILTGLYPTGHGVRDNGLFVLGEHITTLAEMLAERGYATAAAVGAFPLDARFGLDQGFDLYDDHFAQTYENALGERTHERAQLYFDERPASLVNEAVLPWLDEHHDEPFFLWVHYFDPHHPLQPPAPYNQLFANDPYLGEIAFADEAFGHLIAHLEDLGIYHRTLVVMTADHGEGRGDHGEQTHSLLAYNSTLRVPLVLRPPGGRAALEIDQRVGTVDIMPTLMDLLGFAPPTAVHGRSLVPLIERGGAPTAGFPRSQYAETLTPRLSQDLGELRVLFDRQYKLIYGPRSELYDLDQDPGELDDLIDRSDLAAGLERKLAAFIDSHAAEDPSTVAKMDAETRARLEALGYLQTSGNGSTTVVERLDPSGTPPQDRVGDINDVSAAKHLLSNDQPLGAGQLVDALLERNPGNAYYLQLRASVEIQLGQLEAALATLDTIRATAPASLPLDPVIFRLVVVLEREGRAAKALSLLADLQAVRPTAAGHWFLASLHQSLGEPDLARYALEYALELDPAFDEARVDLAVDTARLGDLETAESELRRALADGPYNPKAHYNLGMVLFERHQDDAALDSIERAIELEPSYLAARLALVTLHHDLGRDDDAERQLEALVAAAPSSPEAEQARALLEGAS